MTVDGVSPGWVFRFVTRAPLPKSQVFSFLGGLFDSRPVIVCAAIAAMQNRAWTQGVRNAESWLNVGLVRKKELARLAGNDHVGR